MAALSIANRRLVLLITFIILPGLLLISGYVIAAKEKIQANFVSDFAIIYESAHAVLTQQDQYAKFQFTKYKLPPDFSRKKVSSLTGKSRAYSPNLNPPILNLLLAPLAYLSYGAAFACWNLLNAFWLLAGLFFIIKTLKPKHPVIVGCTALYGALAYFPTYISLQYGEITFLLFFLIAWSWYQLAAKKTLSVGVGLGLAFGLKLFLGIFLVWGLVRKEYRFLLGFSSAFLFSCLLPLIAVPIVAYSHYLIILKQVSWYAASWNVSGWGMLARAGLMPTQQWVLCITSLILLGYAELIRAIPRNQLNPEYDQTFSATLVMAIILSPLGWLYYFPLLLIPMIVVWMTHSERFSAIICLFLLAVAIFLSSLPHSLVNVDRLAISWFNFARFGSGFYTLLILLGLLLYKVPPAKRQIISRERDFQEWWFMGASLFYVALLPSMAFIIRMIFK